MISSIITPVKWYNTIQEQDRFSADCEICDFELISDKTRMLPFQFRRPTSGALISQWYLRKACNDQTIDLVDTNNSLFTNDTGFWALSNAIFDNGKLKFTGASMVEKLFILTAGKYYEFEIVVNELSVGYSVEVITNSTVLMNINATGTYKVKYLAMPGDSDFTILQTAGGSGSPQYMTFEYIQIKEYVELDANDIELPISLLSLINIGDYDVINYCGDAFENQLPCGKYYMVIKTEDEIFYYSEVITVKDFIPSRSPYIMLEWYNNCDLGDVIFQTIDSCSYKNRLYIDGPLSNPEYPIKEEGEEDGNSNFNPTFQKWEKKLLLTIPKCPEFIVDALTAVYLHDTIEMTRALRKKQIQVLSAEEIKSVEVELQSVLNDCATNIEMKLLLNDKVVDSTCCVNTTIAACLVPDFTFTADLKVESGMFFGEPTMFAEDEGLYIVTDGVSLATDGSTYTGGGQYYFVGNQTANFPVGTRVRMTGTYEGIHIVTLSVFAIGTTMIFDPPVSASDVGLMYKITTADISAEGQIVESGGIIKQRQGADWVIISNINTFGFTVASPDIFFLRGGTYKNCFVKFEFITYNSVTLTTVTTSYVKSYTTDEFSAGVTINNEEALVPIPIAGTITIKAICYSINCSYPDSNSVVINF
ncbi:MAG: hypothetical protein WAT27_13635 [Chitinophagales bacterium]